MVIVGVGFIFTSTVEYVLLDECFGTGSGEKDLVKLMVKELLSHACWALDQH